MLVCHSKVEIGPVFAGCPIRPAEPDGTRRSRSATTTTCARLRPERDRCAQGIWRWSALLPRVTKGNRISLG